MPPSRIQEANRTRRPTGTRGGNGPEGPAMTHRMAGNPMQGTSAGKRRLVRARLKQAAWRDGRRLVLVRYVT